MEVNQGPIVAVACEFPNTNVSGRREEKSGIVGVFQSTHVMMISKEVPLLPGSQYLQTQKTSKKICFEVSF